MFQALAIFFPLQVISKLHFRDDQPGLKNGI
jgi:hypothetical protein